MGSHRLHPSPGVFLGESDTCKACHTGGGGGAVLGACLVLASFARSACPSAAVSEWFAAGALLRRSARSKTASAVAPKRCAVDGARSMRPHRNRAQTCAPTPPCLHRSIHVCCCAILMGFYDSPHAPGEAACSVRGSGLGTVFMQDRRYHQAGPAACHHGSTAVRVCVYVRAVRREHVVRAVHREHS